ncbi:MAG: hypothetical protein ACK5TR_04095 [Alphaproteobacteria bacterium]
MRPLCVDLDGTLMASDVLEESLLLYLHDSPFHAIPLLAWFFKGRPFLKSRLGQKVNLDPKTLPYHEHFLAFLKEERAKGRPLYLVTASDEKPAEEIARHLCLFDGVMASDGVTNLRAHAKADALVARFGEKGFDYAGNSSHDLPVWEKCKIAIAVETPSGVLEQLKAFQPNAIIMTEEKAATSWLDFLSPAQFVVALFAFLFYVCPFFVKNPPSLLTCMLALVCLGVFSNLAVLGADLVTMRSMPLNPLRRRRFLFAIGACDLPMAFKTLGALFALYVLTTFFLPLSYSLWVLVIGTALFWHECQDDPHPMDVSAPHVAIDTGLIFARAVGGLMLV